jgi:hypothetical protein
MMACPRYSTAPPLGIMPRWLWDEHCPNPSPLQRWNRLCELGYAHGRYVQAGLPVPNEWLDELEELQAEMDA